MSQPPTVLTPRLRITAKIEEFENSYRRAITNHVKSPLRCISLFIQLSKEYKKLEHCILSLKPPGKTPHEAKAAVVFESYLKECRAIHVNNIRWLAVYCDLTWPFELTKKTFKTKDEEEWHRTVKQLAALKWEECEHEYTNPMIRFYRIKRIVSLKKKRDALKPHSPDWRLSQDKLSQAVYSQMMATIMTSRDKLRLLFQITVARQSLREAENDESVFKDDDKSFLNLANASSSLPQGEQRIADWIKGYLPRMENLSALFRKALTHTMTESLVACQKRFYLNSALRVSGYALAGLFLLFVIYFIFIEGGVYQNMAYQIKKWRKMDAESVLQKQKQDYINQQVMNFKKQYSEKEIRENVELFVSSGVYLEERGFYLFAEYILKGYLMMLSGWDLSASLKRDVVSSAYLLDPQIGEPLRRMSILFGRQALRESHLRETMLRMKKDFIRHGVFPFIFLAVKDDVPYLLMYPEIIEHQFVLTHEAMDRMGLKPENLERFTDLPITIHVVDGSRYPFKDRAGYFEGEFAVVFRSLAQNVEWTAHHETGHIIDHIRSKYKEESTPKNSEVHAMLFPMIFSKGRKHYIKDTLVSSALRADKHDYYAQAARGILNAASQYQSEHNPGLKRIVISNRFEKTKINEIQNRVLAMNSEDIRMMSYSLYQNRDKYFSDVPPGRYLRTRTNFQELITGVHGITQRGFVLESSGIGGERNGPLFIREGTEEGDDSDVPFDFWAFMRRVLRVLFNKHDRNALTGRAEPFAAAVLAFVLIEAFAVFLHMAGKRIRLRKFYGQDTAGIIDAIYDHNAWSQGLSYGDKRGERSLLKRVLKRKGPVDDSLKKEILSFKKTSSDKQCTLLDICLCLAHVNPAKTNIINKFHDLLFFLPFVGPVCARSPFLFKAQSAFKDKESFNEKIKYLASSSNDKTTKAALLQHFHKIISRYNTENGPNVLTQNSSEAHFDDLESLVFGYLESENKAIRLDKTLWNERMLQMQGQGTEFDQLAKYYPGDDIRRIDWNVTARSVKGDVFLRKYINPFAVKIGFLMDMRYIDNRQTREQWARDFVRAMHVLGRDNILDSLIFIMRNGTVQEEAINIKINTVNYETTKRIFMTVKNTYRAFMTQTPDLIINGLVFYEEYENEAYAQQIALTDFSDKARHIKPAQLNAKGVNILVIGVKMRVRESVGNLIGPENQAISVS